MGGSGASETQQNPGVLGIDQHMLSVSLTRTPSHSTGKSLIGVGAKVILHSGNFSGNIPSGQGVMC